MEKYKTYVVNNYQDFKQKCAFVESIVPTKTPMDLTLTFMEYGYHNMVSTVLFAEARERKLKSIYTKDSRIQSILYFKNLKPGNRIEAKTLFINSKVSEDVFTTFLTCNCDFKPYSNCVKLEKLLTVESIAESLLVSYPEMKALLSKMSDDELLERCLISLTRLENMTK